MKQAIAIFAIATLLVACGGKASTEATTTDSTTVSIDSATVGATSLPPAGTNTNIDSTSVVK